MKIEKIDHIVLTVKSIERTCSFYENILGMERKIFGDKRIALHFGVQKINLHQVDHVVDKNVLHASCGSADICLITKSSINEIVDHLKNKKVHIIAGPSERTGANGPIDSVYFYDPDENLIELSTYSK